MNTKTDDDQFPSLGDTDLIELVTVPEEPTVGWPGTITLEATDQPPLVMGHDGDDTGMLGTVKFRADGNGDPQRALALLAPQDMLNSGHGFMVRSASAQPVTTAHCEICGDPLIASADGWVCEFTDPLTLCGCNACLYRAMWLRGEYRPKGGRPAKRCGTAECKRKAARERQRKSRAAKKAGGVTETP